MVSSIAPMKRLLVAAAAVLAAACTSTPETPRATVVLDTCRLPGVDVAARCGGLEVWEDREAKSGRRIKLDIAVIPARLRARQADPIVVLAGGPGQGAVSLASQVLPLFTRLNDARDIVLIDQRGTGNSHPLDCDDEEDATLQSMFEDTLPQRVVQHCLETLDADPSMYITSIAVEDYDEALTALGYGAVNLWGGSYGTRVALEFLRRHGSRVRSVVLDGVAPAGMKLPLSFVADGDAALERLLDDCDHEERCRQLYPGLRKTIADVRGELARHPARASIQDPRTGERETIDVSENVFLSGIFRPLYVAELASLLPFGISAAAQGDFNPLLAQNLEFADDVSENLSIGMHLSVICAEDVPRITPEDLDKLRGSFFGRALVDDFINACRTWPKGKVPADFYDPVRSAVPVLMLSGGIDPATPPRHAQQVAATLANARHFVAPRVGHGVSLHGCAPRLVESFVKAPAEKLDGKCLERIPRPLFVLPLGTRF
jgi:pimeloyl-ACP methyl ester carboxylesterase